MTDDYRAIVARLRRERGMSLEDLAFEARKHAPQGSVSLSLIQKRLAPGSTAAPSPEMLEGLARALEIEPAEFPEYRLAKAREMLDERAVGLDQALANHERIVSALRQRAVQRGATAKLQREQDRQEPRPSLREALNEEAAS